MANQRRAGLPIIRMLLRYLSDGSNADLCRKALIGSGNVIVQPETSGAELMAGLKTTSGVKLDAGHLVKGVIEKWSSIEFVILKLRRGALRSMPSIFKIGGCV